MKEFQLGDKLFKIEAVPLTSGVTGIKFIYPENSFIFPAPEEWFSVLKRAVLTLESEGNKEVQLRIEKSRFEELIPVLPELGFRMKHERCEFHSLVRDLPDDTGSPFIWKPLEKDGVWNLEKGASLLHEVALGDPDYDPSESAMDALNYYFNDPKLTTFPECLQFGFLDGKLAALIIAQIRAADGWSRITYMGIHPDFRGKGLGKWLHRKGFSMMKKLGGKNYFGGTVSSNKNMIKLFNEHGCTETRILQEWVRNKKA